MEASQALGLPPRRGFGLWKAGAMCDRGGGPSLLKRGHPAVSPRWQEAGSVALGGRLPCG